MKKPSVSFYTLGCRLNQSETAVLKRIFEIEGYSTTDFGELSDIVVVNTCTVTERGDADTRKIVGKIKRINPQARIALIGCQAQIQKDKLIHLPQVHWVIGTAKKMDLPQIIQKTKKTTLPQVITPSIPSETFTIPIAGVDSNHTRANIKIQDGCNFFCSYCEIPYARGRARSRNFDDIIKEARILAQSGHQEIVITGINVGMYKQNNHTLMDIIKALEDIPALKRIRISSIEPTTIPQALIKYFTGQTKLCRHLHIPLQSACNPILKAMNRKYTFEEYKTYVELLHETIPDFCVGTDIIVGFPGESDHYFNQTRQRVEGLPVQYLHVFSYSKRQKALSRKKTGEIAPKTISQRSKIIRTLAQTKRLNFYKSLIGQKVDVLFEQKKDTFWTGLTDNYVRVSVKSEKNITNELKSVQIREIKSDKIIAYLLNDKINTK